MEGAVKPQLLLLGLAVLLVAVVFASDPGRAARMATDAAAAPAAATTDAGANPVANDAAVGQLVLARCGGCHSLDRLSQHPQNAAGWRQTIAQMQQLGAQVGPDEEPELVEYLARHFGR